MAKRSNQVSWKSSGGSTDEMGDTQHAAKGSHSFRVLRRVDW